MLTYPPSLFSPFILPSQTSRCKSHVLDVGTLSTQHVVVYTHFCLSLRLSYTLLASRTLFYLTCTLSHTLTNSHTHFYLSPSHTFTSPRKSFANIYVCLNLVHQHWAGADMIHKMSSAFRLIETN